jgi:hypothetical protein
VRPVIGPRAHTTTIHLRDPDRGSACARQHTGSTRQGPWYMILCLVLDVFLLFFLLNSSLHASYLREVLDDVVRLPHNRGRSSQTSSPFLPGPCAGP